MHVDDAKNAVIVRDKRDPIPDRAHVIADVQNTARLYTAEYSFLHSESVFYQLALALSISRGARLGRAVLTLTYFHTYTIIMGKLAQVYAIKANPH
jgi:hypothetical protein